MATKSNRKEVSILKKIVLYDDKPKLEGTHKPLNLKKFNNSQKTLINFKNDLRLSPVKQFEIKKIRLRKIEGGPYKKNDTGDLHMDYMKDKKKKEYKFYKTEGKKMINGAKLEE